MNSTTHTLSPLRQRFIDDMRMRKLSPKTISGYLRTVLRFYDWLGRSPDTATAEDLRSLKSHSFNPGLQIAEISNAPFNHYFNKRVIPKAFTSKKVR